MVHVKKADLYIQALYKIIDETVDITDLTLEKKQELRSNMTRVYLDRVIAKLTGLLAEEEKENIRRLSESTQPDIEKYEKIIEFFILNEGKRNLFTIMTRELERIAKNMVRAVGATLSDKAKVQYNAEVQKLLSPVIAS